MLNAVLTSSNISKIGTTQRGVGNYTRLILVEDTTAGIPSRDSILNNSALGGFDGLSRDVLGKLLRVVPGALDGLRHPPATDRAITMLLLKAIFNGISKEKLEEIYALRSKLLSKERAANAGTFLSANIEHGAG